MGFFSRRRLPGPNVPADWIERRLWLDWEPPRNAVAGEASNLGALVGLAGPTCEDGYCFPRPVLFVREPTNPYDGNAFRAEVDGQPVGYLRRQIAEEIAAPCDRARCSSFTVAGLVRGGSTRTPNLGCHVWLSRRLTPGPHVPLDDDAWGVPWPPSPRERSLLSR